MHREVATDSIRVDLRSIAHSPPLLHTQWDGPSLLRWVSLLFSCFELARDVTTIQPNGARGPCRLAPSKTVVSVVPLIPMRSGTLVLSFIQDYTDTKTIILGIAVERIQGLDDSRVNRHQIFLSHFATVVRELGAAASARSLALLSRSTMEK
jgi:hypothetical protein